MSDGIRVPVITDVYFPRQAPPRLDVTPGACDERVEEVGFEEGHEWKIGGTPIVSESGVTSTPLYCRICGENGWRIQSG